jgi:hypothetical protein
MNITFIIQQTLFVFRFRYLYKYFNFCSTIWLRLLGMKIGKGSDLSKI